MEYRVGRLLCCMFRHWIYRAGLSDHTSSHFHIRWIFIYGLFFHFGTALVVLVNPNLICHLAFWCRYDGERVWC